MEVDKTKKNDSLKKRMDMMFNYSSQVEYSKNHLLPVIQAGKSLIGMNLTNPSKNILKWLENCISDYEPDYTMPASIENIDRPDVLITDHLQSLILSNDVDASRSYLSYLIESAYPLHIIELLFEISLMLPANRSSIFCWYAFKTIQFMDIESSQRILYLALDSLHDCENSDDKLKFILYCFSYEIVKVNMIRHSKIIPILSKKIDTLTDIVSRMSPIPENLLKSIYHDGYNGLIKYLSDIDYDKITYDYLILLDSIRSYLKYGPEKDEIVKFKYNHKVC